MPVLKGELVKVSNWAHGVSSWARGVSSWAHGVSNWARGVSSWAREVSSWARFINCRSSSACIEGRARQNERLGSWSRGRVATQERPPRVRNHFVGERHFMRGAVSGRDASCEEALYGRNRFACPPQFLNCL